jgi:peptidoglycan/LPS O-acetylase OafA/YrhL
MQYGVLWSLAVEEHFYLLWPGAVRSLSRRRVAIVAITICAAFTLEGPCGYCHCITQCFCYSQS